MRVTNSCAKCLYDKQCNRTNNEKYLAEIKNIIDSRSEDDISPYLVYLFNQVYERYFGKTPSYTDIKKRCNEFVLKIEDEIRNKINNSENPLAMSLVYARIGNYIDFGAMSEVNEDKFLSLLDEAQLSEEDTQTINSFISQCDNAENFLLIADNAGEIVLDKLMMEQLKKRFPNLKMSVLVRGGEALNDVTYDDAIGVGIDKFATVISNGMAISGTMINKLPEEARKAIDEADVILSKGQGNYESLCDQGLHIFYSFLCKCEMFTSKFQVPLFTGIFVEES